MSSWILIIFATIAYAGFQFFSAKAGGKIDSSLVPLIIHIIGLIIILTFLLSKVISKSPLIHTQRSGLIYSILAGCSVTFFVIAFQKIFQQGGNLSFVSPLIFGGAIALSTILGALFLKESLGVLHILGIAMVLSGIALITFAKA